MKYFLDTEFIEGTQVKFFGFTKPTIDLISIGIVSEDGREYYAICNEFNLIEAWNRFDIKECCKIPQMCGSHIQGHCEGFKREYWLRDNVLRPIFDELQKKERKLTGGTYWKFTYKNMNRLLKIYGKRRIDIANDICSFIYGNDCGGSGMSALEMALRYEYSDKTMHPEFYGYYSAYDWVVFCWIFGHMNQLPKGFPMYCRDLKQMMDERGLSKEWKQKNCPDPIGEHNALVDAQWNKKLYNLLRSINNEHN